jgi:flagellar hook-associated protein 3 FlgL
MRLASSNFQDRSLELIQQRQVAVQQAQERLVSGKRVTRPSDDPTAAARLERALSEEVRLQASQRSLDASRGVMKLAEQTVGEAGDLMQRARELMVEAGNATYSDSERKTLADRIRGVREDLLRLANRGDGVGAFLFGGQGAGSAPFVDAPGGVQFRSLPGQVTAQPGDPLPMTVDGAAAFLTSPTGNGVFVTAPASGNGPGAWINSGRVVDPAAVTGADYSIVFSTTASGTSYEILKDGTALPGGAQSYRAGQAITFDGMAVTVQGVPASGDAFTVKPSTRSSSVFDTLDRAARELGTPGRSGAQVAQSVDSGLTGLDASLNTLLGVRSQLGSVLDRTDSLEQHLSGLQEQVDVQKADANDIDLAKAVSDLQSVQTGYDAALKAYSMVQRMSLFDYLR